MLTMGFGNVPSAAPLQNPLQDTAKARIKVLEVHIRVGLGTRAIPIAAGLDEQALHAAFAQWFQVPENAQRYAGQYAFTDIPFVGDL